MRKIALLSVTAGILGTAVLADPLATVVARQEYYKALGGVMKPMGELAKNFDAEQAKVQTALLVTALSKDVLPLYVPGTSDADLPGKTRAMAKIWDNLEDVTAKNQALQDAAKVVVAAAEAGDGAAFAAAYAQLGGTCKSCHDAYRVPE